jgi:subtilisin-like proprotein convertase family protein
VSANGTWSLFVRDFSPGDGGQFAGGWSLEVSPDPPPPASPGATGAPKKCKKGQKLKKGKCVKKKRKK